MRAGFSAFFRLSIPLAALVGCHGSLESTVSGTLTYQDRPVPHALMNFHNQGRGPMAYAMTEENGEFQVLTASKKGVASGKYKVAIEAPREFTLPAEYKAIATSGLEYDIQPGHNTIDIALK